MIQQQLQEFVMGSVEGEASSPRRLLLVSQTPQLSHQIIESLRQTYTQPARPPLPHDLLASFFLGELKAKEVLWLVVSVGWSGCLGVLF